MRFVNMKICNLYLLYLGCIKIISFALLQKNRGAPHYLSVRSTQCWSLVPLRGLSTPSYDMQEASFCLPCQSVQSGSSLSQNACCSPCFGLCLILPSPFIPLFSVVLAAQIRQLKTMHSYNPRFILLLGSNAKGVISTVQWDWHRPKAGARSL